MGGLMSMKKTILVWFVVIVALSLLMGVDPAKGICRVAVWLAAIGFLGIGIYLSFQFWSWSWKERKIALFRLFLLILGLSLGSVFLERNGFWQWIWSP